MLPEAPDFLSGRNVEIEYVSPLAKAQKSSELQSIMRAIEILGSLANVAPVFDYVNFDNLVKHLADIVGMPQKLLKSSRVNSERQQAQAQAQEQQTNGTDATSSTSWWTNSTFSKSITRRSTSTS